MLNFGIIVAARNAEKTITMTLHSLSKQRSFDGHLYVTVIDDGSQDSTYQRAMAYPGKDIFYQYEVLHTDGEGVSAARNKGIASLLYKVDWLTFVDSDDVIAPDYFLCVANLIDETERRSTNEDSPSMVFCNLIQYDEAFQGIRHEHPLRRKFSKGNQCIDLESTPQAIHTSAAAAFFRSACIVKTGVRFKETMKYSEDADFIVRFLMKSNTRIVLAAQAHYFYRIRQETSTSVMAWSDPCKYISPLKEIMSWLSCLQVVPDWIQYHALYELYWYLEAERQVIHPVQLQKESVRKVCGDLIQSIGERITPENIQNFNLMPWSLDRQLMVLGVSKKNKAKYLLRQPIRYSPRGRAPVYKVSTWTMCEKRPNWKPPSQSTIGKSVKHSFYDTLHVWEHVDWFRVEEDPQLIEDGNRICPSPFEGTKRYQPCTGMMLSSYNPNKWIKIQRRLSALSLLESKSQFCVAMSILWTKVLLLFDNKRRIVTSGKTPQRVRWLLADRAMHAEDNAEHFYRYLRDHGYGDSLGFLLSPESSDWTRLEKDGFNLYDINHAERLLSRANYMLFSDLADPALLRALSKCPPKKEQLLVFLQHGILTNDISRWVNPKRIDLFIASSEEERNIITQDGSPYVHTRHEVRATGFARFDRLARLSKQVSKRDVILIAPTWNAVLRDRLVTAQNYNQINEIVQSSKLLLKWIDIAKQLENITSQQLKVCFFLHPLYPDLFKEVMSNEYEINAVSTTGDIQKLFVRTRVVVTDVSSVADECSLVGAKIFRYKTELGIARRERSNLFNVMEEFSDIYALKKAILKYLSQSDAFESEDKKRKLVTDIQLNFLDGHCCDRIYRAISAYGES
ncbi:MAG: CDP-glycerol glycerophosphotransferase family protein [Vagococcus sp.]|nr:CDP-glycerol glycerophosphotransferase family protein [Vagococcus sp.]